MEYLYHSVRNNMTGTTLYPLNELKEIYPEIYETHVAKYAGREGLLTSEIPPLHCLWNDVLHLTAVAPSTLKESLAKADIDLGQRSFFKVPVSLIQGDKSVAFTYNARDEKEYEPFDSARMDIYGTIPDQTIEYYRKAKQEGVLPLMFHLVPHVLYKGSLDTKDFEIVQT